MPGLGLPDIFTGLVVGLRVKCLFLAGHHSLSFNCMALLEVSVA